MKTLTRTIFFSLAALAVVSITSSMAVATPKKALWIAPGEPHGQGHHLPRFGFSSFNVQGYGERVTNVKWNSRAARLGLEPGDVILSVNGYRLNYHGSWSDALSQAIYNGGHVQLKIRDVRTGRIVHRQTFIGGGNGPITPKYQVGYGHGPNTSHGVHHNHDNFGYGQHDNGNYGNNGGLNLTRIVKLIDQFND